MTRAELLDLFTPIYDEFAMMAFAEHTQQHQRVADVIEDPTKDWKFNAMSGLGEWDEVSEDSDEGLDHFVIGYEGTVSQVKYRKYFYVTFAVNDQMEYADLKSKIVRAKALGRGGRGRVERLVAGKLYGGFSDSAISADEKNTFANDHPQNPEETGIEYDNLLSGAFSHDNLELAEKQISDNYFDLDGIPIMPAAKPILVYAPALKGQVERVMNERAEMRPGDLGTRTPQEINIYKGNYDYMDWIYLSAKMGGSDTAWYILYPTMQMLKLIWASKPRFASWIDNLRHRYYFDGWMWCVAAITDWRLGFASSGL